PCSPSPPAPHSFPTRRSSDLDPQRAVPDRITPAKFKPNKPRPNLTVYRLEGVGIDGAAVIAKRCTREGGRINPNPLEPVHREVGDRKSTRLNSSHDQISYAVF